MQALVLNHAFVQAFPGNYYTKMTTQSRYEPDMETALESDYSFDAHTTQYSLPKIPLRLDVGMTMDLENLTALVQAKKIKDCQTKKIALPQMDWPLKTATTRYEITQRFMKTGIPMCWVFFDIDGPPGDECPKYYREIIRKGVDNLFREHPGLFYETRGGARICYSLPTPMHIRNKQNAMQWTALYKTWMNYLSRWTGIQVTEKKGDVGIDSSCSEWQRLLRLPHATRNRKDKDGKTIWGKTPEKRLMFGELNAWEPLLASQDKVAPRSFQEYAMSGSEGIFLEMFAAQGNLGSVTGCGGYESRCPRASDHSDYKQGRSGIDSACIVFGAKAPGGLGTIKCEHKCHKEWTLPQHWIENCGWTNEDFKLSEIWRLQNSPDQGDSWGKYEHLKKALDSLGKL